MRHQLVRVDAVRSRDDDEPGGVLVIGLVAEIVHQRQLFGLHLRGNLLDDLVPGDLERQRRDHQIAVFELPPGPLPDRPVAGLVHVADLGERRDDLRVRRIIRTLDVPGELRDGKVGIVEQVQAGVHHLAQIVRRDVRGQADGDSGAPVEQHVRKPRRQQLRLAQRPVEVLTPLRRPLVELGEQRLREFRQPRLGVPHGRERFRFVGRAPVPLPVHERVTERERLRHEDHGLVAGAVAVRMELADDVADRARRFLELCPGREPELRHGVDDPPLHRLKTVGDARQRPIEDDVHRVVEVRLARKGADRLLLDVGEAGWRRNLMLLRFRFTRGHRVPAKVKPKRCRRI